jgi:hypothetical protein
MHGAVAACELSNVRGLLWEEELVSWSVNPYGSFSFCGILMIFSQTLFFHMICQQKLKLQAPNHQGTL